MSREAMKLALLALKTATAVNDREVRLQAESIVALKEALAEEPAQPEPVDSAEKAGAYMDARLWEFIDMAAAWPEAKPDTRTWDHVLVYAPNQEPKCGAIIEVFGKDWRLEYMSLPVGKHKLYTQQYTYTTPSAQRKPLTDEQIRKAVNGAGIMFTAPDIKVARAIEAAHGIKDEK